MRFVPLILILAGCTGSRFAKYIDPNSKPEANLQAAARVDQVGRQLLAANPLVCPDATFQVIGHRDPMIFHRDRHGVFISDALVEQCNNDGELSAVLASELGKMVAEERNLARMGYTEPFAQLPSEYRSSDALDDPQRFAEAARDERGERRKLDSTTKELTDPKSIAVEMLKAAGQDEKALNEVEPLLVKANRNRGLLSHLGGSGGNPVWSR